MPHKALARSCQANCAPAGKVGGQVEVKPADLPALVGASTADVTVGG